MVAKLSPHDSRSTDSPAHNGDGRPPLAVRRRVGLPSGRAVIGALLMTVAALGVFVSVSGANDDSRQPFVVAARALPAGSTLTEADLTTARLDLGSPVDAQSFVDPVALVGERLIVPVGEGELVQRSTISTDGENGAGNEFSFRVPTSRSLNGDLRAGDLVDIYVTIDRTTSIVARGVGLLGHPSDAGRGELVLRVSIEEESTVLAVVDAANRGELTIVRTTHADNTDDLISTNSAQEAVEATAEDPDGSGRATDGDQKNSDEAD